MSRSFYSLTLFFAIMYNGVAILKSTVFLILGLRAGELSLLGGFLAFEFLVSLVWSLILLKYFRYKGYRFTAGTLVVAIMLSIVVLFLQRNVLSTKQLSDPYIVAILASLISGIVYAGSLVVSRASERLPYRLLKPLNYDSPKNISPGRLSSRKLWLWERQRQTDWRVFNCPITFLSRQQG